MKKRLGTVFLSLLLCSVFCVSVRAEQNDIMAVEGNVTINVTTDATEGTPVSIFILPEIIEAGIDVTAEKVENAVTPERLALLGVEYFDVVLAGENGLIFHECKMKDSLPTGNCNVIFTFMGDSGAYLAGSFEHVGKNDIANLVSDFNLSQEGGYAQIINEDINGDGLIPAKEILRKSSADISYYNSLVDKTDFCSVLFGFKPDGGFSLTTLVSKFNETGVWMRLRAEKDTLSTIKNYNGEGLGKYWNIDVDDESDFSKLSSEEQSKILDIIKTAKYTKAEDMEKGFIDNLVLSLFREVKTREDLADLIGEDSTYSTYFAEVREIVEDADLNEYYEALLYNAVLKKNKDCTTMAEIKSLFEKSIPEEEKKGGGGGGSSVSASGGYKSGTASSGINLNSSPNSSIIPDAQGTVNNGFKDVSSDHWAKEYIEKLFKNGVVNGVGNNNFAPSASVKKQDFVKILVGALGMELSESPSVFTDNVNGAYYEKYLMTAYEKGLVSGTGDSVFGIDTNIKREDAAVILSRVLSDNGEKNTENEKTYNDIEDCAEYAKNAVKIVSDAGIFSGDENGNFNPKAELTRAETCAIIVRLAEAKKGE